MSIWAKLDNQRSIDCAELPLLFDLEWVKYILTVLLYLRRFSYRNTFDDCRW